MRLSNLFCLCLISIQGYAAEYEISKIWSHENEHHPLWDAKAINQQGQILGSNVDLGKILIDANGEITQIPKMHIVSSPIAINNDGDVLMNSGNIGDSKAYIWNKAKDLISIDVFNSSIVKAKDFNDNNQVIGKYIVTQRLKNKYGEVKNRKQERAFFWENGEAIDISPEHLLANAPNHIKHNYHISEINLMCINNHGDIAGYCFFVNIDDQHEEKEIKESGFLPFLWTGFDFEFLPIILQNNKGLRTMKLTDEQIIVVPLERDTYVWERHKCFEEENILPKGKEYKPNREVYIQNFEASAINDQGEILGILIEPGNDTGELSSNGNRPLGKWTHTWSLWKAKSNTLTPLDYLLGENKLQKDPFLMSTPSLGWFVGINNKGQILGHVFVGSGLCRKICLLNPIIQ